jgi:hypothetical protein
MSLEPKHEHDCDACVYLGSDQWYDYYFCPRGDQTLIARYGPDGQYDSGMCFYGRNGSITEAGNRAIARGLITREELGEAKL